MHTSFCRFAPAVKRVILSGSRVYRVDSAKGNRTLPSVTTVLNIIEKAALLPWALRICTEEVRRGYNAFRRSADPSFPMHDSWLEPVLAKAIAQPNSIKIQSAVYGTRVHAAIDAIIRGVHPRPPVSGDIAAAVSGFETWYATSGIRFAPAGDTVVYSLKHGYAGATDAIGCRIDGSAVVVCDFKTSNSTQQSYALQLAAYATAVREMWIDGTLDVRAMLESANSTPDAVVPKHRVSRDTDVPASPRRPRLQRGRQATTAASPSASPSDAAMPPRSPSQRAVFPPQFSTSKASLSSESVLGGNDLLSSCSTNLGALPDWDFGLSGLLPGTPLLYTETQNASITASLHENVAASSSLSAQTNGATIDRFSTIAAPAVFAAPAVLPSTTQPLKQKTQPLPTRVRRRSKSASTPTDSSLAHPIVDDAFLLSAADSALAALSVVLPDARSTSSADSKPESASSALPLIQKRAFSSLSSQRLQQAFFRHVCPASRELHTTTEDAGQLDSVYMHPDEAMKEPTTQVEESPWSKLDPHTTPIEALIVRFDKATGAVDVQRVVSLPTSFSAFLAALRLHEVLKMLPAGGCSGSAAPLTSDAPGPLLERLS